MTAIKGQWQSQWRDVSGKVNEVMWDCKSL